MRDEDTGMQINHLTTSPVTNHVCKFYPENEGRINDRYSYQHMPLGQQYRNYLSINIDLRCRTSVTAELVAVSTNMFKQKEYMSDDEE